MRYLLDTNILADLVRRPQGQVAQRIREVGESRVCTSIIVAAEIRFGVARKGSERLTSQVESVLGALEILPFEVPADVEYGALRAYLEVRGEPIGGNDLLIAAHSLSLDCTLVTDNEREFGRIPKLQCENWLR